MPVLICISGIVGGICHLQQPSTELLSVWNLQFLCNGSARHLMMSCAPCWSDIRPTVTDENFQPVFGFSLRETINSHLQVVSI